MKNKPQFNSMQGFSLIELMIGITLGLLIMTALITLFVNTSRTNTEMAKTNSQIENGRFAMQLLENDIVHGGYWGGFVPEFDDLTSKNVPGDVPSTDLTVNPSYLATDDPILLPCKAYADWGTTYRKFLIGIPVQAYDAAPAGCAVVANKKDDSDVLLVRHAATCLPGIGNCEADVAGKLYFQPSFCELEIDAATPANPPYRFNTTDFTTPGTGYHKRTCVGTGTPPALPITSLDFADKRKFISSIYYIRDYANTVGDGIPTLMRSEFDLSGGTLAHKTADALISGIEGFRVELGIDSLSDTGAAVDYTDEIDWLDDENLTSPTNRGDGSPDGAYVRCTTGTPCTAAQLTNVVSAKIYVLARAEQATAGYTDSKIYNLGTTTLGPFNDHFKRHVFSTTVRLNNVSGRRETP